MSAGFTRNGKEGIGEVALIIMRGSRLVRRNPTGLCPDGYQ
jgi:hypothetical protein